MNASRRTSPTARSRGAILICVLACCLTALSLGVTAVHQALQAARESKQTHQLRQTEWLLHAGLVRVQQQMRDPSYTGETWEIPAEVTGSLAAVVTIDIAPQTGPSEHESSVGIIVEFGLAPHMQRSSGQFLVAHPVSANTNQ